MVVGAGYSAAFLVLGAVAAIGLVICLVALPETRQGMNGAPRRRGEDSAGRFRYRCRMNAVSLRIERAD